MDNNALFGERLARIQKVVNLEPVDRVPVVYMGVAFAPRYMGVSMKDFCADPELALQANLNAIERLGGLDGVNLAGGGRITPILTGLWASKLGVPGRDLPDDSLWQVREAEVMTQADYDTIIAKGWMGFFAEYLPRVIDPSEFFEAMGWLEANGMRIQQLHMERGLVVVCNAPIQVTIPFEYLCGGRSMSKFFFDLYRIPDKVEAVMEVMLAETLAQIEALPPIPGIAGTWVGGWRSASALIAPKLWDRFVWPYCVKIIEAHVAKGYTPVLHWDQDWTRDLGRLKDLPAKKCILNPDGMTDMKKFKEQAGDHMAMMGDVPASLLVTGTPEDVDTYVKELIELFEGRGLIVCPGCDAPINAKPGNIKALIEATHKYGVMSR
jgi:uroporphyrinogen-III decarboxylase